MERPRRAPDGEGGADRHREEDVRVSYSTALYCL